MMKFACGSKFASSCLQIVLENRKKTSSLWWWVNVSIKNACHDRNQCSADQGDVNTQHLYYS